MNALTLSQQVCEFIFFDLVKYYCGAYIDNNTLYVHFQYRDNEELLHIKCRLDKQRIELQRYSTSYCISFKTMPRDKKYPTYKLYYNDKEYSKKIAYLKSKRAMFICRAKDYILYTGGVDM